MTNNTDIVEAALKRWSELPEEERNGERPFVLGFNAGWEAAENASEHDWWAAGEAECPSEIKAPNGELHTLLCKKCGKSDPTEKCQAALASLQTDAPEAQAEGLAAELSVLLAQSKEAHDTHPSEGGNRAYWSWQKVLNWLGDHVDTILTALSRNQRDEALEEAAKVAEKVGDCANTSGRAPQSEITLVEDITDEIRALKGDRQ